MLLQKEHTVTHSNPNLTPVHIVDKNGHSKTVYVSKADPSRDQTKMTIKNKYGGNDIAWIVAPPAHLGQPGVYGFTISAERRETGVKLPRAKKERDVVYTDSIWVPVPSLSPDDAPVGMKMGDTEYRTFGGTIYKNTQKEAEDFFADLNIGGGMDTIKRLYNQHEDEYIVVDGEVWEKTGEPVYVIETESYLRHDSLSISTAESDRVRHMSNSLVFSANERDVALDKMNELMKELSLGTDSNGSPSTYYVDAAQRSMDKLPVIEVKDPSLVGSTYDFPERIKFTAFSTYDLKLDSPTYERDLELGARRAIDEFRDIVNRVGAVVEEGDGTRSYDTSKLPQELVDSYRRAVTHLVDKGKLV